MRSYLQKWKNGKNRHNPPKHCREFQDVRNYKWWCVSKVERSYCAWWSVRNAKWNQISLEKLFVTFWITEQRRLLWLLSKPIKRLKLTSIFKGTVYPELKILFTHPHFIPNLHDFLAFKEMFSSMFIQFLRYPNVLMILNEHWSLFLHAQLLTFDSQAFFSLYHSRSKKIPTR